MQAAVVEATKGLHEGGIPIGSALVIDISTCTELMTQFIQANPTPWQEDIGK